MDHKVSCLMVTANRLPLVKRAIRCFRRQTHYDRELIVVDDASDGVEELLCVLRDPSIVFVRPSQPGLTLGELRNLSVESATGRYVMQWDDDDWYHPNRIKVQLAALRYTEEDFCFLNRWTLAWPERNLFAYSKRLIWEGSFLGKKEKMIKYESLRRGEDTVLVQQLIKAGGNFCFVDDPDLYIYVVHGQNTYGPEHFSRVVFEKVTRELTGDKVTDILRKLELGECT